MFSSIRMIFAVLLITGIAGAGMYVMKLRADNATLKANQIELERGIEEQNKVLEQQKQDFQSIIETNKKLTILSNNLQKEISDLDNRFNKGGRDFGKTAIAKDKAIQRIINKATANALRCVEISSGAALTEKELSASKKSEINTECPSIANPNYVPY